MARDGPPPFLESLTDTGPVNHQPGADVKDRPALYEEVTGWLRQHAGLTSNAEAAAARTPNLDCEPLPLVLNRLGAASDADLQAAFLAVSGLPPATGEVDREIADTLSAAFMRYHRCIVFKNEGESVHLGLVDPFDEEAVRGV